MTPAGRVPEERAGGTAARPMAQVVDAKARRVP